MFFCTNPTPTEAFSYFFFLQSFSLLSGGMRNEACLSASIHPLCEKKINRNDEDDSKVLSQNSTLKA